MRADARQVGLSAGQSERGKSACRMAEHADSRSFRIRRNAVFPVGVAKQRINNPRRLPRPFRKESARRLVPYGAILPVVARMPKRRDQIAVASQGLRQTAVPEFRSPRSMAKNDQALETRLRWGLDGDTEREWTHRNLARRRLRRVKQSNLDRLGICSRTRHHVLPPAGLGSD